MNRHQRISQKLGKSDLVLGAIMEGLCSASHYTKPYDKALAIRTFLEINGVQLVVKRDCPCRNPKTGLLDRTACLDLLRHAEERYYNTV